MNRPIMALAVVLLAGCASTPPMPPDAKPSKAADSGQPSPRPSAPSPAPAPDSRPALREVFPHVYADAARATVELDATVPINAHDEKTPRVYLEVIACTPDTKEHEALAVTRARPSHVHAALLLAGFRPGRPGEWDWEGEKLRAIPPEGDALSVSLVFTSGGREVARPAQDFVIDARNARSLSQIDPDAGFVFAGSRLVKRPAGEVYWADGEGTLIGLTTFGAETIAWSVMHNPDSGVEEPFLIANSELLPEAGTPLRIRITRR